MSQRTGNRKSAQSDVDPPTGEEEARGEECNLSPHRRVWLVNRKDGKLKVGVRLQFFCSYSPCGKHAEEVCQPLSPATETFFFFLICLHTKTPKLSNLTCSSLANNKLQLFSSAALHYLSPQAAASPKTDQITPLLISLLSVNHVLYGKSPTCQAASLLLCVTTKPNYLQATHEQTLFSKSGQAPLYTS